MESSPCLNISSPFILVNRQLDAAVRTLLEFLSSLDWDHEAASDHLQRLVMDRHGCVRAIGVIDPP
jgi:hypothetical protein